MLHMTCTTWRREILQGIHQATDNYRIALYGPGAKLDKTLARYSRRDEVSGPGYEPGGQSLQGFQTGIDGDAATLGWTRDPVWPNASITARFAVIYNHTREDRAVAVTDFGRDHTSTNGPFEILLHEGANGNALIRLL